jgi:hypothetical protein
MATGEEQRHEASRLICRACARLSSRVAEGARVIHRDTFDPSPPLEVSLLCTTDQEGAPRSLLLEGPEASTDAVLRRLEPYFREPVMWKRRGLPLELPAGEIRALILQDVDGLSPDEQTQLIRWIDAKPAHDDRIHNGASAVSARRARPLRQHSVLPHKYNAAPSRLKSA